MQTMPDFTTIVASKAEILSGDTQGVIDALSALITSPDTALHWCERVDFAIDGYNDTRWELFEMDEVRDFITKVDNSFPYWLYFLSKQTLGLHCIIYCFLPPFLKPEARANIFPDLLNDLLSRRWFPAMNEVCDWVGMTESENKIMTNRVAKYLRTGPFV